MNKYYAKEPFLCNRGLKRIKLGKAVSTIQINQKRTKNCAL